MQISPTTQHSAAAPVATQPHAVPAAGRAALTRVTPQAVSAAILQRANNDGDGKTGAAALNDGDAAALAAARQATSAGRSLDVKA